jgi:hypothetical protein
MRTLAIAVAVAAVLGVSAQERPPTVSDFFRDFTSDWMRANPNQAATSRYFSGAEQEQFEQQLSPETPEFRHSRVVLAQKGLELAALDRARMTETERVCRPDAVAARHARRGREVRDYFFRSSNSAASTSTSQHPRRQPPLNTEKDAVTTSGGSAR